MEEARRNLEKDTNDYLTQSNDNTQVLNVPHATYNNNLEGGAVRGGADHALWDTEHPNAALARDMITSLPFTLPLVYGAGEVGLGSMLFNPYVDAALTSWSIADGIKDITNGETDWMTGLKLTPAYRFIKPTYNAAKEGYQTITGYRPVNTTQKTNNNPFSLFDDGEYSTFEYVDDVTPTDTYMNNSLYKDLHPTVQNFQKDLQGAFTRHLSRAKAKGYGDELSKV